MVWTSPKRSDVLRSATHSRQASFDGKNRESNVTTPNLGSTETITSRPLHNTYAAAQRLQQKTRSNNGQSRPSTAMSFTTYNSDMILGRGLESRSTSPLYPSHISQTPTPSMGTLLPQKRQGSLPRSSIDIARKKPTNKVLSCHTYLQLSPTHPSPTLRL
jgi:hypothetical protein